MTKKIEMTQEEQQLYNDLKKLVKRANQRILRLERLTGEVGTYATKQLYDYLDVNELNARTGSNRIRLSKKYNLMQFLGVKKAVEQFLNSGASTIREVKKIKKQHEIDVGLPLDFSQSNVLYRSRKFYNWIYQYIPQSEFWDVWVSVTKRENWDRDTFAEQIALRANLEIDEELKQDLYDLYDYVTKG